MKRVILSIVLAGITTSVFAANTNGFYVGASLGQSETDLYTTVQSGASDRKSVV